MGITGLLPLLKPITRSIHLSEISGARAAIDASGWLHRGTLKCSYEIMTTGDSDKYVDFCMGLILKLKKASIEPLMVFDGNKISLKGGVHVQRRETRALAEEEGFAHRENGDTWAATKSFNSAVSVTSKMTIKLIAELERKGIDFIVSPYEADAQLAYLSRNDLCDVVISEDSDCLPFGCKLTMFKFKQDGTGEMVDLDDVMDSSHGVFPGFTQDMLLDMCILSGCDYLPSIKGIGLKRAMQFVEMGGPGACVLETLRNKSKYVVTEEYAKAFKTTQLAFRHHGVFCPTSKTLQPLTPLEVGTNASDKLDFLGGDMSLEVVQGIASGRVDPRTWEPRNLAM